MNTSHTPGPWEVLEHHHDGVFVLANGMVVAKVVYVIEFAGEPGSRRLQNAHLMAAAPDLLAALKMAVLQNEHDMLMTGEELRQCAAAIKRAEGT